MAAGAAAPAAAAPPAAPLGPWFREPTELRPTPSALLGQQRRVRRPPALVALEPPTKRAKAAPPRRSPPPLPLIPPDHAPELAGAVPLRHGRALLHGRVVVVPQVPADFQQDLEDPHRELLLVELVAPGGAWLDDVEADDVLVSATDAAPSVVPLQAVRDLVRRRVATLGRGAPVLRSLYALTRPRSAPDYKLVLVALADLTPAAAGASSPRGSPAALL